MRPTDPFRDASGKYRERPLPPVDGRGPYDHYAQDPVDEQTERRPLLSHDPIVWFAGVVLVAAGFWLYSAVFGG